MNMTAAVKASRETICRISISKERLLLASYDLKPHGISGGFKFFHVLTSFFCFSLHLSNQKIRVRLWVGIKCKGRRCSALC